MTQAVELFSEQQIALKVQKGIREAEDALVTSIQAALDKKNTYGKLEESQFRNLVRVAASTESPEVTINFLRYQVGRDNKWGKGADSLAETIIKDIKSLKQKAKEIADKARSNDLNGIWMELIRRYLGYGARYLKYLLEGQSSQGKN